MKKIDLLQAPEGQGTRYPPPYDEPCKARHWKRLGDAAGLTQFGVNLLTLPPGVWSSQRHWHAKEDEFVYVLSGDVVLVSDDGEELLRAGDCAGFPAGVRDGHTLQNRTVQDAVLLVIGSRAGVVLGVLGLAAAAVLWRRPTGRERLRDKLALPMFAVGAGVVLLAAVLMSRDEAVQRITGMDSDSEGRLEYLPTLLKMAGDFFPVGSGFGGFDPLYRVYEPHEYLSPSYLNHAHNELMELAIQGGLPGLVILAVFLVWLAGKGWTAFRGPAALPVCKLPRYALSLSPSGNGPSGLGRHRR